MTLVVSFLLVLCANSTSKEDIIGIHCISNVLVDLTLTKAFIVVLNEGSDELEVNISPLELGKRVKASLTGPCGPCSPANRHA